MEQQKPQVHPVESNIYPAEMYTPHFQFGRNGIWQSVTLRLFESTQKKTRYLFIHTTKKQTVEDD